MVVFVVFNILLIIPLIWMNKNIDLVTITERIIDFGLPIAFALFIGIWTVFVKRKKDEKTQKMVSEYDNVH